jgi:hypothetical protein
MRVRILKTFSLKPFLLTFTFLRTVPAFYLSPFSPLIAILLIKFLKFKASINWSMANLVALLRWNLMTYRNLWLWLDEPFDTPPDNANFKQTLLPLPDLDSIMKENREKSKKNFET